MKKKICLILSIIMLGMSAGNVSAEQNKTIAFPGAEGGGMYASGGRGCDVYVVTNLEDYSADETPIKGSLRDAVSKSNRTIVFNVSGTINLKRTLEIKNKQNITIAGQTAPGDGITVYGYDTNTSGSKNIIVRYMRFRAGSKSVYESDSLDALWGRDMNTAIFDHISTSWSTDETMSLYRSTDMTVQWCITSESLTMSGHTKGKHGYGAIWSGLNTTFHHNLIANHTSRSPRISGGYSYNKADGTLTGIEDANHIGVSDVRNNVIYNWGFYSMYGGGWGKTNVVNNYYKSGNGTRDGIKGYIINAGEKNKTSQYYIAGNYREGFNTKSGAITSKDSTNGVYTDSNATGEYAPVFSSEPFKTETRDDTTTSFESGTRFAEIVTTDTPSEAYEKVLARAGATYPKRDAYDARVVSEVRNSQGKFINKEYEVGGLPCLDSESRPEGYDSDSDGMPDEYEKANGFNPNNSADGKALASDGSGYTNLENYLNSIVDPDFEPENPNVEIAFPENNAYIAEGEDTELKISASDNDGIKKIDIYNGSEVIGQAERNGSEYSYILKGLEDGTYYISAKAEDTEGNKTQSTAVRLYVNGENMSEVWKNADIGNTALSGTGKLNSDGSLTVKGQGVNLALGKSSEIFHYMYQDGIKGDCEISAKISSLADIDNDAFGGIMIRESLDNNAKSANVGISWAKSTNDDSIGTGTGKCFKMTSAMRKKAGSSSSISTQSDILFRQYDETVGYYVKLTRKGNTFTASISPDGEEWTVLSTAEIDMKDEVYIGFAVDSNQDTNSLYNLNTAVFSDIKVSGDGAKLDGNFKFEGKRGDAGADNKVTSTDALLILQKSLNLDYKLPVEDYADYISICDMDGNNIVTANDALYVLNIALRGEE